jgi:hypothetical protein
MSVSIYYRLLAESGWLARIDSRSPRARRALGSRQGEVLGVRSYLLPGQTESGLRLAPRGDPWRPSLRHVV